jgi:hypothetical protein
MCAFRGWLCCWYVCMCLSLVNLAVPPVPCLPSGLCFNLAFSNRGAYTCRCVTIPIAGMLMYVCICVNFWDGLCCGKCLIYIIYCSAVPPVRFLSPTPVYYSFFLCRVSTYIQVCECLTTREGCVSVCIRPQSVPLEILPVLMPLTHTYPPVSRCHPSGPPKPRPRSSLPAVGVQVHRSLRTVNVAPTKTTANLK